MRTGSREPWPRRVLSEVEIWAWLVGVFGLLVVLVVYALDHAVSVGR